MRHFDCAKYNACLNTAAVKNVKNFDCTGCKRYKKAVHEIELKELSIDGYGQYGCLPCDIKTE